MSIMPQIWSAQEIAGMHGTVDTLRRMRNAATLEHAPFLMKFRNALGSIFHKLPVQHDPAKALSEAEKLADYAGDFFAARLTRTEEHDQEYERWQDTLSDARVRYGLYGIVTFARTSVREVVQNSLIDRFRNVSVHPEHMLTWDLTMNNNLCTSLEELFDRKMGVVSPFSGDYLVASTYGSYFRRSRKDGKTFPTKAIALSEDLSKVVVSRDAHGRLPFQEMDELGIFVDTSETGLTVSSIKNELKRLYPYKIIREPVDESPEYEPSEEIQKYRQQYPA